MPSLNDKINLFNYIMNNKNIPLSSGDTFNPLSLAKVAKIISSKDKERLNNWQLSKKEIDILVEDFCKNNVAVTKDTPYLFLSNPKCIAHLAWSKYATALGKIKVNKNIMMSIKDLEKLAIDNNYVLSFDSPAIFRNSYAIAFNSIKLDPNSSTNINFEYFSDEEKKSIVDYLISLDLDELEIGFNIIDYNFITYANKKGWITNDQLFYYVNECPELYNYMYENGILRTFDLKGVPLDVLSKRDDFEEILLRMLSSYNSERVDLYRENISEFASIIKSSFGSNPSIKSIKDFYRRTLEEEWERYKFIYKDWYIDLFSNIISSIYPDNTFDKTMNATDEIRKRFKANLKPDEYREFFKSIYEIYRLKRDGYIPSEASKVLNKYISIYLEREKEKYIDYLYKKLFSNVIRPKKDRGIYLKQKRNKDRLCTIISDSGNYHETITKYSKKYNLSNDEESAIYHYINDYYHDYLGYDFEKDLPDSEAFATYKKALLGKKLDSLVNKLNDNTISIDEYNLGHLSDYIYQSEDGVFYARESNDYTEYEYKEEFEDNKKLYKIAKEVLEEIYFDALSKSFPDDNDNILIDNNSPLDDEHFEVYCPITFNDIVDYIFSPYSKISENVLHNHKDIDEFLSKTGVARFIFNDYPNNNMFSNENNIFKLSINRRIDPFSLFSSIDRNIGKIDYSNMDFYNFVTSVFYGKVIDGDAFALLGEEHIRKAIEGIKEEYYSIDSGYFPVGSFIPNNESNIPYLDGEYNGLKYKTYNLSDGQYVKDCIVLKKDATTTPSESYVRVTDSLDNFIGIITLKRMGNTLRIEVPETIYDNFDKIVSVRNLTLEIAEVLQKITKRKFNDKKPIHFVDIDIDEVITDRYPGTPKTYKLYNYNYEYDPFYMPSIYTRPRDEEVETNNFDEVKDKIYKIISLSQLCHDEKVSHTINHDENSSYIVGDNWFIIYDETTKTILDSRVYELDKEALNECKDAINSLKNKKYKVLS